MGATSRYGWAYPELFDPPNTAAHIKTALENVEATVGALDDKVATPIGGEWRDARSNPALNTGANKLVFATNVVPANGLTFNGTDTWQCQTSGPYAFFGQLRSNAGVNGGICVGATSYSDATHIVPFLGFTNGTDYAVSGVANLTVGQQFCFYFYNNGAATSINNGLRNAMAKVWRL
ncbi:hypothetical protein ACIBCH_41955 [Amycolatopsis thailandensis]|uniref:hypothetical protein n=1 Tax=Amycolatopsis thailandensis TaxID=589330 RepID=UPI0037A9B255